MVVKYARVWLFQSLAVRCVENDWFSECEGSSNLDVRSEASGQEDDQDVSLAHALQFHDRSLGISVWAFMVPIGPGQCAFPTASLQCFQKRLSLLAPVLSRG